MAKPKGYVSFKIKISQTSKLHYTANIFNNLAEMRVFASKNAGKPENYFNDAHGSCTYWTYPKARPPRTDNIGAICLWKGDLGIEMISHECVHAALGALHRKGVGNLETGDIGGDNAEELCYIAGYLVKQIYEKLNKLSLSPPNS